MNASSNFETNETLNVTNTENPLMTTDHREGGEDHIEQGNE